MAKESGKLAVSDNAIDIKNVAWRGDLLAKYHALFVGGSLFDSIKADFLLKKPTETVTASIQPQAPMPGSGSPESSPNGMLGYYQPSSLNVGMDAYSYRVKKVSYKPLIASLFGYLASRVFPRSPEFAKPGQYDDLLTDCDGDGRGMLCVARDALIDALTYSVQGAPCGSYLYLQEVEPGSEDIRIGTVDARCVIDWEGDQKGNLARVRTRHVEPIREEDFGPQTKVRWTWRAYDAEGCNVWAGEKSIRAFGRPSYAVRLPREEYAYGVVPFIRVKLCDHQFLMDQIAPPIIEQFNLESDIASLCGKISNAQLVINSMDKNVGNCVLPQLGIILLDQGMDGKFISPDSKCADPLFKYKDALRESLYNAINASAMRASADLVQNPRQAAVAKAMDLEPWRAWSITFSDPVKAALAKALRVIAAYHGAEAPELIWPEPLDISKNDMVKAMGGEIDGPAQEESGTDDEPAGRDTEQPAS